jgi:1-phosphofructokinase
MKRGSFISPSKLAKPQQVVIISLHSAFQKVLLMDSFSPGKVNRASESLTGLGCKGTNVATILAQMGIESTLITIIPEDDFMAFSRSLDPEWVHLEALRCQGRLRTCTTVVSGPEQMSTEVIEGSDLHGYNPKDLLKIVESSCGEETLVLFTGSLPSSFPTSTLPLLFQRIRSLAVTFMVDLVGAPFELVLPSQPDIIKINRREWEINGLGQPEDFAPTWGHWVMTQGPEEVFWWSPEASGRLPIKNVDPAYPIGAGDAFAAGLIQSLLESQKWTEALGIAVNTASKSCQKLMPGEI